MNATHTPGPWKALFDDDEEYHGVESTDIEHEGGGQIAKVYGTDNFPCLEATEKICQEMIANAHLVAAAPDMLAALKMVAEDIGNFHQIPLGGETSNAVLVAIATATRAQAA